MSESVLQEWEATQFARFRPVRGLIVGLAPSGDCVEKAPAFAEEGKNSVRLPCTTKLRRDYGLPDAVYHGSVRVSILPSLAERRATEKLLPTNTSRTKPRAEAFLQQVIGSDPVYIAAFGDHAKNALIASLVSGPDPFKLVSDQTGFLPLGNVRFFWATHPSQNAWNRLKCNKPELLARIRLNMAAWSEGFSAQAMPMAAE